MEGRGNYQLFSNMSIGWISNSREMNLSLKIPADLQIWIEARKRFKLSHVQVQMARELGRNPKKLGALPR